jgi:hypothetical protein
MEDLININHMSDTEKRIKESQQDYITLNETEDQSQITDITDEIRSFSKSN